MTILAQPNVDWTEFFSDRALNLKSSAVRELLKVTEQPNFVSFAGGFPAPELFPVAEISETITKILQQQGPQALQYSATEGYRPLREWVAARARKFGVPASVDNVLITTGSQQALDLLGKVLINPGDPVVVETPTYLAALQAWRLYGANFLGVPLDEAPTSLANLTVQPKLVYCIPNFQNPTGATLSADCREALVEWNQARPVCLVEDDPYGDIRFAGQRLPRLIEFEAAARDDEVYNGSVVYLSTFSKVLAPGLRVGAMLGPRDLIAKLVQAKQASDLHTPTLSQMVAHELAEAGFLESQARKVAESYRERRDVMLEEVYRIFPEGTKVTPPEGGMFLWLTLPEGFSAQLLWERALEQKVAFVPGTPFYPNQPKPNTLRLNFSNSNPETILKGMKRLELALRSL
ncbi:MAG: PLP-dependent aminotransferase family protein [Vulcanimicrobiota bacterium]